MGQMKRLELLHGGGERVKAGGQYETGGGWLAHGRVGD